MLRVRFAPSPTGNLHLGSVRTALFNWLIARKEKGTYILRIEDTDLERSKEEYTKNILDGLKWLGLDWDEGPEVGGQYGPYFQKERIDKGVYKPYIDKLIEEGKAYYCYCTPEELAKDRELAMAEKRAPKYEGKCRSLSKEQIDKFIEEGRKPAIRFIVPDETIVLNDLIRGRIEFDSSLMGDLVIQKADGSPAYNFAVVVDDITMKINLIIRGEDHLSNTPKQIQLYKALDYEVPKFAHMSMILGPDRSKLSKRHGATSVVEYQEKGYLKEAIINYLTLLGWSHPEEKEIIPVEEIISTFSLERVGKSGAIFDIEKFTWMNGQYIRMLSKDELFEKVKPFLIKDGIYDRFNDDNKLKEMVGSVQENLTVLSEAPKYLELFLEEKPEYSEEHEKKNIKDDSKIIIVKILEYLKAENNYDAENIKKILEKIYEEFKVNKGKVLKPLRYALCGIRSGPNIEVIMSIFGKEKTVDRLEQFVSRIS